MKKVLLVAAGFLLSLNVHAQDAIDYQVPPKDIADLLLARPTPAVNIDSKGTWLLLSDYILYPSVEQLARPELRVAGLRINPRNFAPSRQYFISNFTLKDAHTGKAYTIDGLPQSLLAGYVGWNPSETKILFTQTNADAVDLYVIDIASKKASRVNTTPLNVVLGRKVTWLDDNTIIYTTIVKPVSAAPVKPLMPKGPSIQESIGKTAPSATFEDLIKSPYDEHVFEFYATSQLVQNKNGLESPISQPAIYLTLQPSPDKKYLLERTLNKPFSYLVRAPNFASTVSIKSIDGRLVKAVASLPSSEGTPSGYDNTQNIEHDFEWRGDVAATLIWSHPLDSGLIKKQADYHDAVYALDAPFSSETKLLFKTQMRFRYIEWGNSALAIVYEGLQATQVNRVSRYNFNTNSLEKLYDLSETDGYGNPGYPVTVKNAYGRYTIATIGNGKKMLMNNTTGSSPKGDFPFLAEYDLAGKKNDIVWRCNEDCYEYVADVLDSTNLIVLTSRQSQKDVPNYFIKNLSLKTTTTQLTNFANPYPQLAGITHEKISYKRADGVDLTGELYLPKGYNKEKDGPLPVLMWAYPQEFYAASDAAQVRGSKNIFTNVYWGSPIFWVTQGYAILDNAEMPIIAKDGKKPNDTFVEQLSQNAEAAINKLAEMGVGDKNRIAVGGHSYGAFMTANLLAHTKLFKAGIARSGAYNRTLTPFGFQNEERTYWQDPKLYYDMSPFSFADQIKTPLLLIHGDADDNPGTFPINSERLFNAIKGLGGTVRLVYLPYEAHGYRGRENLLHMLWEMNRWLDMYVKNAK